MFASAYYLYRLTRGAINDPQASAAAFAHARELIGIERASGLFVERAVQSVNDRSGLAAQVATWLYVNAQTTILLGALVYTYVRRNDRFFVLRNTMFLAMAVALIGYVVMPTAPPRFFPEWGFEDTVARVTGVASNDARVDALFNPYAAMPSMHVANALIIGWALRRDCRTALARGLWLSYPAVVTWVVLATGNHWTLDTVAGIATAALSLFAAGVWARARPHPRALRPWRRPATSGGLSG